MSNITVLTHCHKFFRLCWMDSNTVVEIFFGCAHFNSNTESLQHLICSKSNHMEPYNLTGDHMINDRNVCVVPVPSQ